MTGTAQRTKRRRKRLALASGATALVAALSLLTGGNDGPTCKPPPERAAELPLTLVPLLGGRLFERPVQMIEDPAEPGAWLVVGHRGLVQRVRGDEVVTILDISDRVVLGSQWGLQQIALHPRYPADGRLFATYFTDRNTSRLSAFRMREDGTFDPASEVVLLSEAQRSPWHCVAGLAFGPDRMLYVAWGGGDYKEADPKALRTKMLRLDVDRREAGKAYAVPPDNPFVGTEILREAYAVGLRNPWRFTFDRATGEIWLGDTGENGYEEIDRIVAGGDYGWPYWEGTACRWPARCSGGTTPPVFAHANSDVCAVVGGYVYRGEAFPWLRGKYVYADPCTGRIYALDPAADGPAGELVGRTRASIAAFAEDARGELYVAASNGESSGDPSAPRLFPLYALAANVAAANPETTAAASIDEREEPDGPSLAALGCIGADGPASAPGGTLAYTIAMPAWHEGAEVHRFLSEQRFPDRVGLEESIAPNRGSVFLKTFVVDGRPVETQMLVRRKHGGWSGYDYRWNADGTDAQVIDRGETVEVPGGKTWTFPGPDQCFRCHDTRAGMLLGFTIPQLNYDLDGENQIERLEDLDMLAWTWRGGELPAVPVVSDERTAVAERARAYLDVNCAHCHQPGAWAGDTGLDMRRRTPLALTGLCGRRARTTFPGRDDALLIAPGAPERSLVSLRMHATGLEAMPPGRQTIDAAGVAVVDEWIRSLSDCEPTAAGHVASATTASGTRR